MKKEYDFKKMTLKRRGTLPALPDQESTNNKIRITIALDKEVVDYFKSEAKHPGAFPYQTQINQALRQLIGKTITIKSRENMEELKKELLHDPSFIQKLLKEIERRHK